MKCLVTGATGFIGAHLVRWLVGQDCQVAILVRPNANLWRVQSLVQHLHLITGDLTDVAYFDSALRKFAPTVVFHLGWTGVSGAHRDDLSQIQNLYSTLNLLQVAKTSGCQCWIGLGSQAEYGRHDGVRTEDSLPHPNTLYGAAKLSAALLSRKLCECYDIRFVWLRLFAAYGPMDASHFLIPYVILTLLDGKMPTLTQGKQQWDYLFVQDVARAIWQTAKTSSVQGIFNLASGHAIPIRQIVEQIRDLIDPSLPLRWGDKQTTLDYPTDLRADISRLQNAIDWSPQTSLDEGLKQTIAWYRSERIKGKMDESF